MEKYLTKIPPKKDKQHLPSRISAEKRVKDYPAGTLHADDGVLFCTTCNVAVDHLRKFCVDVHLKSEKHRHRLETKSTAGKQSSLSGAVKRQMAAAMHRNETILEWVKLCTALNIPLIKSDHELMRTFFSGHVRNGGSIPGSHQLRERYLPELYEVARENLKQKLQGKKLCVIFDETPDVEGRCVLNILFAICEVNEHGKITTYFADAVFMDKCNHNTVAQQVVRVIQSYGIDYDDVVVFNTDNAAYMLKAYKSVLKALFPISVHITCLAHIINLIGDAFRKPFKEVDEFMMNWSRIFFQAGSRKRWYFEFL